MNFENIYSTSKRENPAKTINFLDLFTRNSGQV